jgi:hypothetical protein
MKAIRARIDSIDTKMINFLTKTREISISLMKSYCRALDPSVAGINENNDEIVFPEASLKTSKFEPVNVSPNYYVTMSEKQKIISHEEKISVTEYLYKVHLNLPFAKIDSIGIRLIDDNKLEVTYQQETEIDIDRKLNPELQDNNLNSVVSQEKNLFVYLPGRFVNTDESFKNCLITKNVERDRIEINYRILASKRFSSD